MDTTGDEEGTIMEIHDANRVRTAGAGTDAGGGEAGGQRVRGPRQRWRAIRLGAAWAMLVAIGGVSMIPAAEALAAGVDQQPYVVQQAVVASPTASSQGEGTRRD